EPAADELPPAAEAGAEAAAEELPAAAGVLEVLEPLELQAASATVAASGNASASFLARLRAISLYPFSLLPGRILSRSLLLVGYGCDNRRRRRKRPTRGRKTLASRSAPVTMPVASWLKLVRSRAFWMPANASTASTTPMIEPLPPKIDTPASRTIATT